MEKKYKYKIVLLGDFCVGKTSLIRKFVYNLFDDKYLTTIGVNISKKDIKLEIDTVNNEVTLLIWDINGTNGFSKITPQYLSGASAAILVADITRIETISELEPKINEFKIKNPKGNIVVALNKCDLLEKMPFENYLPAEWKVFFKDENTEYFFTSAKTGENVENMFLKLVTKIISSHNE
jgi:small GTP-binding protein